jgi:ribosome maturation factor RimP
MIAEQKIKELVDQKLANTSNYVIEISVKQGNKINILLDNDKGISIDECVAMSRFVEAGLNRDADDFELNIMSPGLTEPFKIWRQYKKNIGKQVDITTKDNKKLKGILLSADDNTIKLEAKSSEKVEGKKKKQIITRITDLNYSEIKTTKLILSF